MTAHISAIDPDTTIAHHQWNGMNEMTSLSSSTVSTHRLDEIVDYFDRILHLFDVRVSVVEGCDPEGGGGQDAKETEVGEQPLSLPDALRPHLSAAAVSTSIAHSSCHSMSSAGGAAAAINIQFTSNTGSLNNLERAKKYWESVQVLEWPSNGVRRVCPTATAFSRLLNLRDSIERSSCAVLSLAEDLHTLEVRGRDDCVAAAVAMVDEAINEDELIQSHLGMTGGVWSSVVGSRYGDGGCRRTKLESEDSSYDSDYENSEPLSSPAASYKQDEFYGKHEDVSRTVSDTLRAEFAEYVGPVVRTNTGSSTIRELGDQEVNEEDVFSDPDYTSRIEFALKLGYTEKQAQVALHKLGPKPQQNELLAELIKLGACNQQKSGAGAGGGLEQLRGGTSEVGGSAASNMVTNSRKLDSYPADGYDLRNIVIDGSNVAMSHGNKEMFSCRGIKLCVDWFKARGHKDITVFVPSWRKEASRPDAITTDQEVLWELEKERRLVFTPSRQMGGRRMACHDDRYILKLAVETDGVVVSNDNYRDLVNENPEFKKVIEERLLMYSFVNDRFMPPDDPLGRHGPSLDSFLCVQQKKPSEPLARACPYGKKCTYGNKCKYYHPERGNQPHKSISDQIVEQAKINIQEVKARSTKNSDHSSPGSRLRGTLSSPFPNTSAEKPMAKRPLQRTKSLVPPSMEPAPLRDVQPSTLVTITPPPPDLEDASGGRQNITSPTWSSPFYGDGGNHLSVAKRLSDPDSCKGFQGDGGANLHRKLQRQLTLNPVYDPRLVHMRSYMHQHQQQQQSMDGDRLGEPKEHLPVARHSSAGAAEAMAASRGWGNSGSSVGGESLHQSVTRIASAPDTFHQWQTVHPSDVHPHYVWGPMVHPSGANLPMPMPSHQMPTGRGGRMNVPASTCEKRNHLYYHLSSIFPKDQVRAVMEAHPDETDPQAICTAILNTYPHPR